MADRLREGGHRMREWLVERGHRKSCSLAVSESCRALSSASWSSTRWLRARTCGTGGEGGRWRGLGGVPQAATGKQHFDTLTGPCLGGLYNKPQKCNNLGICLENQKEQSFEEKRVAQKFKGCIQELQIIFHALIED